MNYCWIKTLLIKGLLVEKLPIVRDQSLVTHSLIVKNKLFSKKKITVEGYQLRIGLSSQDIETLKNLYGVSDNLKGES